MNWRTWHLNRKSSWTASKKVQELYERCWRNQWRVLQLWRRKDHLWYIAGRVNHPLNSRWRCVTNVTSPSSLLQYINNQLTFYSQIVAEITHGKGMDIWMSINSTEWTHEYKSLTPFNYSVQIGTEDLTCSDQQEIQSMDTVIKQATSPVHQVLTRLWNVPTSNAINLPYWEPQGRCSNS